MDRQFSKPGEDGDPAEELLKLIARFEADEVHDSEFEKWKDKSLRTIKKDGVESAVLTALLSYAARQSPQSPATPGK